LKITQKARKRDPALREQRGWQRGWGPRLAVILPIRVDTVCVNQSDTEEQGRQVMMMADIYRNAKGCIAYIGPQATGVKPESAFVALSRYLGGRRRQRSHEDPDDPLGGLLDSQWYLRSWIFQETILPKEVMCLFGDRTDSIYFNVEALGIILAKAGIQGSVRSGKNIIGSLSEGSKRALVGGHAAALRNLRYRHQKQAEQFEIIEMLNMLHPPLASDKRDKIYSVLGLVEKASVKPFNSVTTQTIQSKTPTQTLPDVS
jgi:Heterokaryon incompatibility protein (HET)